MTKRNEETAVAVAETNQEVAVQSERRGFENIDVSSITIPRVKLLQSNSPEVSDRDYDFRAGDVIHGLTMEKLGLKFVPIMFLPDTNILFLPKEQASKMSLKARLSLNDEDMSNQILCRSKDGRHGNKYGDCSKCPLCKFDGSMKPVCTSSINVLALFEDSAMPVVIQFANTSKKHGTKFKNTTYFQSGNLYDNLYKLDSTKKDGNGNSWYEMAVKPAGKPSEELRNKAEQMYKQFRNMAIAVDEDDAPFEMSSEF